MNGQPYQSLTVKFMASMFSGSVVFSTDSAVAILESNGYTIGEVKKGVYINGEYFRIDQIVKMAQEECKEQAEEHEYGISVPPPVVWTTFKALEYLWRRGYKLEV